jgi:NAD(P)-dependent dehydrogenase (short-subunit alcohol dehydrogenase family)
MQALAGRRIVITGGAAGIGRSAAALFAAQGAALTLVDRDADRVKATAQALGCFGHGADVTDEGALSAAITSGATAMGGIDGLVTAAGVMWRGTVAEVGGVDWANVIAVNLTGTYLAARACLPWMEQAETATIVTLGSAQGLHPDTPGRTAYAASKGGVVNLSRALAAELAPKIRVNCCCPGLVDTKMADGVRANTKNYALRRMARPEEIAEVLLFLTSSASSFVTGATLAADGGRAFH